MQSLHINLILLLVLQNLGDHQHTHNGFTTSYIYTTAFHPSGGKFATAGLDPNIKIFNSTDYILIDTYSSIGGHSGYLFSLDYSIDGKYLASCGDDGKIIVWNSDNGDVVTLLEDNSSVEILQLKFNRDNTMIIASFNDNTAKIYSVPGFVETHHLTGQHTDIVNWSDIYTDNSLFLTASKDTTVKIWNADSTLNKTLTHTVEVKCALFSPDGNYVITGLFDGKIILWDLVTGTQIRELTYHTDTIYYMEYSLNSENIVTSSKDNTLIVWNPFTGFPVYQFGKTLHTDDIFVARYSPNQKFIISGSKDNSMNIWRIDCDDGYIPNLTGECQQCQSPCKDCKYLLYKCTSCIESYELIDDLYCVPQGCQNGFYKHEETHSCQKCNSQCERCTDRNDCTLCAIQDNPFIQPPLCQCECSLKYGNEDGEIECVDCSYFDDDGEDGEQCIIVENIIIEQKQSSQQLSYSLQMLSLTLFTTIFNL